MREIDTLDQTYNKYHSQASAMRQQVEQLRYVIQTKQFETTFSDITTKLDVLNDTDLKNNNANLMSSFSASMNKTNVGIASNTQTISNQLFEESGINARFEQLRKLVMDEDAQYEADVDDEDTDVSNDTLDIHNRFNALKIQPSIDSSDDNLQARLNKLKS